MRRTQPYTAISQSSPDADTPVVGTAPTMRTRSAHGQAYERGLELFATHGYPTPIQSPWAGQGLISPAFPLYQSSKVAPDAIKPPILVTRNLYSPVSHANARFEFSRIIPTPAAQPSIMLPAGQHRSRRGGGNHTYPQPFVAESWPTPAQWVQSLMDQGFPGGY